MSFLKRLFGGRGGPGGDGLNPEQTLARAREDLQTKTAMHNSAWGLGKAAWNVDLGEGVIRFDAPDGREVSAPVQVIGTLDTLKGSFLWGWDHPSIPEPLRRHAQIVREHGARHGIAELTTRMIACDEAKAWDFTALACLLGQAQGGYRGPSGTTMVFMTFDTVTMKKGKMADSAEPDLAAGLEPVEAPEVLNFIKDYCREVYAVEKAYAELPKDKRDEAFEATIAAQEPIYERYWRRNDDYWRPSSASSDPEHDLARIRDWRVFARGQDKWRVTYTRDIGIALKRGFDVERFPDGLRITDALF